jgi:hypothetical protein
VSGRGGRKASPRRKAVPGVAAAGGRHRRVAVVIEASNAYARGLLAGRWLRWRNGTATA